MLIAPLDVQVPFRSATDAAAVTGTSFQADRNVGQGPRLAARQSVPTSNARGSGGVQIVGSAPTLSKDVLTTLGDAANSGRNRLDPLTGEPMEIDPVTGEPVPADPLDLALTQAETATAQTDAAETGAAPQGGGGTTSDTGELTPEEQAEVRRLEAIDRRVRAHEAAHKAAGPGVTGPASFTYVTGPDGKRYAVSGEVPITVTAAPGGDPEQAARQYAQVEQAATAPADPSPADRAAAAAARAARIEAEAEARDQDDAEALEQADAKVAARTAEREQAEADQADLERTRDAAALEEPPPPSDEADDEPPPGPAANDDDEDLALAAPAAVAENPYSTAAAAYGQSAGLIAGQPAPYGEPGTETQARTMFSLVAWSTVLRVWFETPW